MAFNRNKSVLRPGHDSKGLGADGVEVYGHQCAGKWGTQFSDLGQAEPHPAADMFGLPEDQEQSEESEGKE